MKRNVLIIGIVVIVIVVVAAVYGIQQMNAASAAATTVRAQTVAVKRGNLIATLAEAGNVSVPTTSSAAFESTTGAVIAGRVAKVDVAVGDKVKAGQVLMELDPSDLQLALQTAQASLSNSQGTLSNSQASLSNSQASLASAKIKASENVNQLIIAKTALDSAAATLQTAQTAYDTIAWRPDAGLTTQATTLQTATNSYQSALANYNITAANLSDNSALITAQNNVAQAQTNIAQAQTGVNQAQIAVTQAQDNLDRAKLVSPISGTVSAVNYNVGDIASGTAVVIVDLSQIQVKVTVAEVDISSIKIGQTAQMTMDALPGLTYTATVAAINPVGAIQSGVVNYAVIVKLNDPDGDVLPGMTANLAIQISRHDNVLLVPLRAVKTQGTQKVATVLYKGQQISTPVTTGLQNDTQVEITSGLNEGDEVVVGATTTTQRGGGGGIPLGGVGGFRPGD